jgi:hypothetical protein
MNVRERAVSEAVSRRLPTNAFVYARCACLAKSVTLSLYVSRTSPLHSSHLNVEAEMNQIPFLIIKWPQRLHSRVRSTFRNRAERGIALLLYRRERERVSRSSAPGTVPPMMPITLLPIGTLRDS